MGKLAQNINPYYNDFDRDKSFVQILFKPGMPVQARELTQLQSIFGDQLSMLADYVLGDSVVVVDGGAEVEEFYAYRYASRWLGTVIDIENLELGTHTIQASGTEIEIVGYDKDNLLVFVNSPVIEAGDIITTNIGSIQIEYDEFIRIPIDRFCLKKGIYYLCQRFIEIEETCKFPFSQTKDVGCLYLVGGEKIVTHKDDSSLLDPAKGKYAYSGPGADRLKIEAEMVFVKDGEDVPENSTLLACYDGTSWNLERFEPTDRAAPDYTKIDLEQKPKGSWEFTVSGNSNGNEKLTIDLCDVPEATEDEHQKIFSKNADIIYLYYEDDGTCKTRKTSASRFVPTILQVYCDGADPNINEGQYWLDTSAGQNILRLRLSDGWEDISANELHPNTLLECEGTGARYKIQSGAFRITPSSADNSLIPVGAVIQLPVDTDGYIRADGGLYAITDYPRLYNVIETTFGGDGVTSFNVPNVTMTTPGLRYYIKT